MDAFDAIAQQIRGTFGEVAFARQFVGPQIWLTVYVSGQPEQLERVAADAANLGWSNLGDWETGLFYPKIGTAKSADAVVEAMRDFHRVAESHGAQVEYADADPSAELLALGSISLYERAW